MDIKKFQEVSQSLTLGFGSPSGLIVSKSHFFKSDDMGDKDVAYSKVVTVGLFFGFFNWCIMLLAMFEKTIEDGAELF